jgi:CheY-like chemotaxis protein
MSEDPRVELERRIQLVLNAASDQFVDILHTIGLNPTRDLRFGDWHGLDLSGADLRGFDFTGADLSDTCFDGALIVGAIFDQATFDPASLRRAADFDSYDKMSKPRDLEKEQTHPPGSTETWDLRGVNILLVEDSCHVGTALRDLLKAWGADVAGPVATEAEAERLISEKRPSVAVVDVNLRGGETAYDLIDRLHERGIPVIATSGYGVVPRRLGKAVPVLQKPVNELQLQALLRPLPASGLRPTG